MNQDQITTTDQPRATWTHRNIRSDWVKMDRFYREQVEDGYCPSLHVEHKPTNWDTDESESLFDGWSEDWGVCPRCFMLRSANGNCGCY